MSLGTRATHSVINTSDRPRDILGLTKAQEADFSQFLGFTGRNQAGDTKSTNILFYPDTSAPTLTDYAATPLGTIIIAPFLAHSAIYIHKAASSPAIVGDWEVFTADTAS